MPALQLGQRLAETPDDELNDLSSEDEAVANDLDMHALILNGLHIDDEPIKSAEEVIKEIDDIMDETTPSDDDGPEVSEVMEKAKEVLGSPLYEESKWCVRCVAPCTTENTQNSSCSLSLYIYIFLLFRALYLLLVCTFVCHQILSTIDI